MSCCTSSRREGRDEHSDCRSQLPDAQLSRWDWELVAVLLGVFLSGPPAFAQTAEWPTERAPRPLAAREVKFPPFQVKTLSNGMQVITVAHHEQPAVTMRLLVRAGAAQDPENKGGLAELVAKLLDQGTTTRSAQQIADQIDSIGGAMGTGSGTDLTFVNAVVMKDSFALAMDLVHDVVRHPAFSPEEIERQREQALSSLRVSGEDPSYVASMLFDRLVYGFHPVREARQRYHVVAGAHHAGRSASVPPPVLRAEQHDSRHRRRHLE